MRILILTQWYIPEPARLLHELAQTLQVNGHEVTVLTGFPNYPSGRLYPGYRVRLWQRETIEGIPIVRVPLYPNHSRSSIHRVINYASFALASSLLGFWLLRRPDVIFVYHPPLTIGMPAYVLSRLWRVPFVYQIQDMWPETLHATEMLNHEHLLRWIGHFALKVYRKADAICVISPGFKANLISKGVPAEKIHVVSNWVDPATYYPAEPEPALAVRLSLAGKFNVMFAGNIGEAQGLSTVVDAAAQLSDLQQVQFVIVGDGVALPRLQEMVRKRSLGNVRFLGHYPEEVMPQLYALADVLLVHLKDDPLFRITIPHKVFAYMASGKPILAAVAGDAANVVIEEGAGISCPPEDPAGLTRAIRQFYVMPAEARQEMAMRGLSAVRTKYGRRELVAQIENILNSTVRATISQKQYGESAGAAGR